MSDTHERIDRQAQIDPFALAKTDLHRAIYYYMPKGDARTLDYTVSKAVDTLQQQHAALLRERDAQIASLTAQVEQQQREMQELQPGRA